MDRKHALLHTPEGVRDLYGKEYARTLRVCEQLMRSIGLYGYEPIQTPTYEFFDVFSKEVGTTPSRELFKFFDRENNTLVLRPDITPSIARCAAKYFMEDAGSLRFCYQGSVFCNISSLQGKLSEAMQVGAELIGENSVYADAEILAMTIDALQSASLQDFQLSIGNVEYFNGICEEAGLTGEDREILRQYIADKNPIAAGEFLAELPIPAKNREQLLALSNSFFERELTDHLTGLCQRAKDAINHLRTIREVLSQYGMDRYVSFDLGLMSKHTYYTGIVFRAYTLGVGSPIAKGGRYDSLLGHFGKEAPSTGFVILVDELMEALDRQKCEIEVPEAPVVIEYHDSRKEYSAALSEALKLRKSGRPVILSPVRTEGVIS
ncbi:MAG: ATP phosphoribosyltransferase regulatory subunit [Lachnospiraceae bacterium]|nr:ATP phosphoribosyltransferase regulatory subunit [Lachnospiraceae bacterium]